MKTYYVDWIDLRVNPFKEWNKFRQRAESLPHAAHLIRVLQAITWATDICVFSYDDLS